MNKNNLKEFSKEYRNFYKFINEENSINKAKEMALQMIKMYGLINNVNDEKDLDLERKINYCLSKFPNSYIIKTNTKFSLLENDKRKIIDDFESKEKLLDYIVLSARNYIYKNYMYVNFCGDKTNLSFDDINLTNYCEKISSYIYELCNKLNVKSKVVRIDPGFNKDLSLFGDSGFHYFNLIYIDDKVYLVDCTYKQFFLIYGNLLERMGIIGLCGPIPGIYMISDEKRFKTAEELLNDGWILLDSNNIKNYFDGFALSYRNASFYDEKGYIDFSTNYTANDYENFLFGDDDQVKHEKIENLGIQKKIIKNKNIIFKTDEKILKKIY